MSDMSKVLSVLDKYILKINFNFVFVWCILSILHLVSQLVFLISLIWAHLRPILPPALLHISSQRILWQIDHYWFSKYYYFPRFVIVSSPPPLAINDDSSPPLTNIAPPLSTIIPPPDLLFLMTVYGSAAIHELFSVWFSQTHRFQA